MAGSTEEFRIRRLQHTKSHQGRMTATRTASKPALEMANSPSLGNASGLRCLYFGSVVLCACEASLCVLRQLSIVDEFNGIDQHFGMISAQVAHRDVASVLSSGSS
jgi:hypothetical protein